MLLNILQGDCPLIAENDLVQNVHTATVDKPGCRRIIFIPKKYLEWLK